MSRAHYSRNGSRIPNPYVDNARPHPSLRTWATVDGCHIPVLITAVIKRDRYSVCCASPVGYPFREATGLGPSEAVRNLDKLLSESPHG